MTGSFPSPQRYRWAFALHGDFPWKRVPGYIIIQVAGATLACLFLR
jgi:aquaporin Z